MEATRERRKIKKPKVRAKHIVEEVAPEDVNDGVEENTKENEIIAPEPVAETTPTATAATTTVTPPSTTTVTAAVTTTTVTPPPTTTTRTTLQEVISTQSKIKESQNKADDATQNYDILKQLQITYGGGVRNSREFEGMEDESSEAKEKYTDNYTVSAYTNLTQQQSDSQQQQQEKEKHKAHIKQQNGKELTLVQKELLYVSQLIKENEKMESDQNIERWNDVPGELETSYFYKIVKGYRMEQILYRSRCINFDELNQKIQSITENELWDFRSDSRTEIRRCACGSSLQMGIEQMTATLNQAEFDRIRSIGGIAGERLNEAFLYLNEVYFSYLKVSRYINNFLMSSENFSQITPEEPVIAVMSSQQTPKLIEEITQIRHMLNVLFFFERNRPLGLNVESKKLRDQPLIAFHRDVENWILSLGSTLLRRASFDDHMFLLQHLLCCPNTSQWNGASLIQFPLIWDDLIASHFVNVAIALVQPVFKGNQCKAIIQEMNDWANYEDIEQERARKFQINEVDLMDIFEQLPVGPFCNFLLDRQQTEYASDIVTNLLKALCTSLFNLRVYKGFTKFVIRTIIVLLSVVAKADRNSGRTLSFNITQEQLDAFIMTTAYFIIALKEPTMWQFVSELPLDSLSHEGMWQFVGMIHSLPILRLPQTYDEWETVDWNFVVDDSDSDNDDNEELTPIDFDDNTLPLDNLADLCTKNSCEGVFVFDTLAYLARVGESNIAITCISTLFHIGFIDERSKKVMMEEAVLKLSYLCESNGANIGYLLRLLFNYSSYAEKDKKIHNFFMKLPLDTWIPDYDTLDFLARVLVKDPQNEYAHTVLKRVHWAADEISLSTNHFAALQVLDLVDWYYKKKSETSMFKLSTAGAIKDGIKHCKVQLKRFQYFKPGAIEEFPEKYNSVGRDSLQNAVQHVEALKTKKGWNKISEVYILAYFLLLDHEDAISEWCSPDQPALNLLLEPMEKGLAVFVLSQLIPKLICKDGEHFMKAITPKFVSVVFKKIFDIDDTLTTLALLIGEPMKIIGADKANATLLADFWIRCATLSEKWTTSTQSLSIIETTLNAYFCFVSKEIPAQFYARHVTQLLAQRESTQKITLFSVLPTANIKTCKPVKYPLLTMSTLFAELMYLMQINKFRTFSDYFTKVEQIINYGLEIPEDFEFVIIYWQLALNLFFSAAIGQQDNHFFSVLQNRSSSMIMRFMRIGESFSKRDAASTVEGMKAKFFFGAASLLQGSQNRPRSFQEVVFNAGVNNQYLNENEILLGNADPARQIHEVMSTLLVELVDLNRIPMYNTINTLTQLRTPAIPIYLQSSDGISKYDAVIKKFAVNISAVLPPPQVIQATQPVGMYDKDMPERVDIITNNIIEYSNMQLKTFNNEKKCIIDYQELSRNMIITVDSIKEEAKKCSSCGKTTFFRVPFRTSELSEEIKNRMKDLMKNLNEMIINHKREIGFYMDMVTLYNLLEEIKRTLSEAIANDSKEKEREIEALVEGICGPLFRKIFETWESSAVNWFVGRKFHKSMLSTTEILAKFPNEACNILEFFLAKPMRINFAIQVLHPCKDKNIFSRLLRILLASKTISVLDNDKFFSNFMPCFEVAIWLSLEPTVEERCAVLDNICDTFRTSFIVLSVRNYLIESFKLLVEYDIQFMAGYAINAIFRSEATNEITNLWGNIDKNLIAQRLSFEELIGVFEVINADTEIFCQNFRNTRCTLYKWFNDFIPFLAEAALKKLPPGEKTILPLVANTFRLYKIIFNTPNLDRSTSEEINTLRSLSNAFTAIVKSFQSSGHHPHAISDLWFFLTQDLQILVPNTTAPLLMQDIVFTPLCDAPWEMWVPSIQDFEFIKSVTEAGKANPISVGAIALILKIFTSVPVKEIVSLHTKEFHETILDILVSVLLMGPTKYDDNPNELFSKVVQTEWGFVSPAAYSDVFRYATAVLSTMNVDKTILIKKTLMVITILRMVCGLKLERESLPEEVIQRRRDPGKIVIFVGDLVNFQRIDLFTESDSSRGVFFDIMNSVMTTVDILNKTSDQKVNDFMNESMVSLMSLFNRSSFESYITDAVLAFVSQHPYTIPNFILYACQS